VIELVHTTDIRRTITTLSYAIWLGVAYFSKFSKIKWRILLELYIRAILSVYFGLWIVLFVDPRNLILILILIIYYLFRFLYLLISSFLVPLREKKNYIAAQEDHDLSPEQRALDLVREYSCKDDEYGPNYPIHRGLSHQCFSNKVKQQEIIRDLIQAWEYEDRDHLID
jgi:hypothetical protein